MVPTLEVSIGKLAQRDEDIFKNLILIATKK
jgi:hypothetical protein